MAGLNSARPISDTSVSDFWFPASLIASIQAELAAGWGMLTAPLLSLPISSLPSFILPTHPCTSTTAATTSSHDANTLTQSTTEANAGPIRPDVQVQDITTDFQQADVATSGDFAGSYVWSNHLNWTNTQPHTNYQGTSLYLEYHVIEASNGIDDISSLELDSLTLQGSATLSVAGGLGFSVNTVTGGISAIAPDGTETVTSLLSVGNDSGSYQGSIKVDAIEGFGGIYGAIGPGTYFTVGYLYSQPTVPDPAFVDPGEDYEAFNGGTVTFATGPSNNSTLDYGGTTGGTFILKNPYYSEISATLADVVQGDVLEIPGTTVDYLQFTPGSVILPGAPVINILTVITDYSAYAIDFETAAPALSSYSYSASYDATNNLIAITFLTVDNGLLPDDFSDNQADANGQYDWSNALNWDQGTPVSGVAITDSGATDIDDVGGLSLTSLTAANANLNLLVVASTLTVGTLNVVAGAAVTAEAESGPVTLKVGSVSGSGGSFVAQGPAASFVDQSTSDPGATYAAEDGGTVSIASAVQGASTLVFGGTGSGFILANPQLTTNAPISGLASGDFIELPGNTTKSVTFSSSGLDITTSAGTFAFTNVSYGQVLANWSASFDTDTGLERIELLAPDTIHGTSPKSLLWSVDTNWAEGVPTDGTAVAAAGRSEDDIAGLTLSGLNLDVSATVAVTASSLSTATLSAGPGAEMIALATGRPVTITVGTITDAAAGTGAPATFAATGAGASFVDQSATASGADYAVESGGLVVLTALPEDTSTLNYEGTGTFALEMDEASPAASVQTDQPGDTVMTDVTTGLFLNNLEQGDALELPGSAVADVVFTADTLAVTTDVGIYDFTNVAYHDAIRSYTAVFDSFTGLEEIAFSDAAPCFAAGTHLDTPCGSRAVERLEPGDLVTTLDSEAPVVWIGHRRVRQARVICFRPHALGFAMPRRDLYVSDDHAIFVEGVLVPAGLLVNGSSVIEERRDVVFYHVELERHAILLAEGAPAESYLDTGNRMQFGNCIFAYDPKAAAHHEPCADMVFAGQRLDRIRAGLPVTC